MKIYLILEESLDDIQKQIDQLKTRISEYEYNQSEVNYTEELKELKQLYDAGVLTKEEFTKAKEKLLN